MPQFSPDWPDLAVQIRRAAAVDGPDKFWPQLVPEVKLVGVFGDNGDWDLHLENLAGDKIMNAMTPSGVCPGAMVYHGTKDGIQKASLTASFLANTGHMFCVALRLCKCCEIGFDHTKRTANLRLRVADTHEYAETKDDYPARTHESSDRLAVFLLSWREEPTSFPVATR
ncbi:hypothetical protein FPHYL_3962 [Fusarium phyllophilum]|uniref:Uncharacterized protein n=1 Tax=Fusarium phyllophilum TaxID=47803 RepID=A0A8H5NHX9_9HYPO|nr:hypothetical protein FPHYL_3962 [Fusarium phyllophilum]